MLSRNRYDIEQDGKEMQDTSGQHKQVPYGMVKSQFFPTIEKNTGRIGQTAQYEKNDAAGCHR